MRYDPSISLGALRLALAVTVVVTHYLPMAGLRMYLPLDGVPVYCFFFLSGYWIAQLWDNKYQKTTNPFLTFYASRAWRIYPIVIASTLLMFILTTRDWSVLATNLILIGENGNPQAPALLNPPAWSLAIELQFYVVAPFFIVFLRNKIVTSAALFTGFAFWLLYAYGVEQIYLIHFVFLFVLGVAFAQNPAHKFAARLAPYSLAAVTVSIIGATNATVGDLIAQHGLVRFAAIVIGLLGIPYVAVSLSKRSNSSDRFLGDLAYPAYLFHWPAMVIARELPIAAKLPVAVAITVGLTLLVHVGVDRPLEHMRRKFVEGRMATLSPSIARAGAL